MSNATARAAERLSFRTRRDGVETVMGLFHKKVGEASVAVLREIAAALTAPRLEAEDLARAMASAGDTPAVRELQGAGLGPLLSAEAGAVKLEAVTEDDDSVDWAESELLGSGEAAERLGVARTTLDNWRKAGKALAFRKGVRNYVYPMRQFARLKPVDGLDKVRAHFTDDEETWEWLVTPNRMVGGVAPIDRLHKGKVEEVVRAAEGAFDYA
ncbi:hypothetical protein [Caballeronia mineralivorans]|jgi:hypothetical protein|uniref:antitoxin Xre/MbcA/ParS-like domain-containing protein n=1 Tax=Caballeronia mineralivorans TaxID=2010198 RepID=UPI0023F50CCA|nr:hypothetical protein [Caballeronia mineralivorans]MDB5786856.1 hypothetical protein [Caballeronia mineralivorans]